MSSIRARRKVALGFINEILPTDTSHPARIADKEINRTKNAVEMIASLFCPLICIFSLRFRK